MKPTMKQFLVIICTLGSVRSLAIDITVQVMSHAICTNPTGGISVYVNTGVPPYTYEWSNGATTPTVMGLPAGTYSVTVTDATMEQAVGQGTVNTLNSYPTSTTAAAFHCPGEAPRISFYAGTENGLPPDFSTGTQHGPGPYEFNAVGYSHTQIELADACSWFSYYDISVNGAQTGSFVTINYTDGTGCPGSFGFTVPAAIALQQPQPLNITGSCTNGNLGSAWVSVGMGERIVRLKNSLGQYVQGPGIFCSAYPVNADGTVQFTSLAPGNYWVIVDHDYFNQYTSGDSYNLVCRDSTALVIPDLGTTCGLISGRVYVDNNANCALNGGENLVPITIVELTPGPYYATTNSNGQFTVQVPLGTYSLAEQHPVLVQSCPATAVLSGPTLNNANVACAGGQPLDVQLTMANGPARPGFEVLYAIAVDNLTPATTGTVTLTMTFDPALSFISAIPQPTSVAGNVITWTAPWFNMYTAFEHKDVNVRLQVPPDVGLIGTTLTASATIATQNTDNDLSNNSATTLQTVTGSYDPNDKLANTSMGNSSVWLINQDEWIDYTIRFQNTGTDTAFNVLVTDTLPPTLDPASIIWGASSHTHTRFLEGQGVLKFYFPNILLPDSNVNEPLSHGFVGFRIRPRLPLLHGDEITNIANIYFDFNPPVITEPSVLVAEFSTGVLAQEQEVMRLVPNPVTDELRISANSSIASLRVITADGREVLARSVRAANASIAVDQLQAGAYLLIATFTNGSEVRERFVKQ